VPIVGQPWTGTQPTVRALVDGLAPLRTDLHSAWLHGSLGSDEVVPYSDVDALVILRDAAATDPVRLRRLARVLTGLRRAMQAFDPVQHHGWFVLTEADLREHCQAYFPHELFAHARQLVPAAPLAFELAMRDSTAEYHAAFSNLARALRGTLPGPPPRDLYQLKDTLSRLLVLPALYLQARDGTAVWKKFSFEQAARDFDGAIWAVMDDVSALRAAWPSPLPLGRLQRALLVNVVARRRLVLPWAAPAIPPPLAARLTPDLWRRADALVAAMQARLGR
jgi:hypothetical protein